MATYTFDIRMNQIVPHTARVLVEADNIAEAIQKVRASDGDGATWEPEGRGFWGDELFVEGIQREGMGKVMTFPDAVGQEIDGLSLAWFKRHEARRGQAT